MEALVEVHTREELAKVLEADARIIGINNRNLQTFATDIMTTVELLAVIPDDQIVVSESGINTVEDIRKLKAAGADAFLIGESLMREPSPGRKLQELVG
jgi:indole-3-glycerol phosphate synthase